MNKWLTFSEPKNEKRDTQSVFKDYVVPMGTILMAILALTAHNVLNGWESTMLAIYVFIVVIALGGPLVVSVVRAFRIRMKHSQLNKRWLSEVRGAVREFHTVVDSRRNDTLWGVWQDAARTGDTLNHIRPNHSHFGTMSQWYNHFCKRIEASQPKDFQVVVTEAASLIREYSLFGQEAYRQFENVMRDSGIDGRKVREVRQNWNHIRDEHNNVVGKWSSLCQEINDSFGQEICATYYEKLKPLE